MTLLFVLTLWVGGDQPSAMDRSFSAYLAVQAALAKDDLATAKTELAQLHQSLKAISASSLDENAKTVWTEIGESLISKTQAAASTSDIAATRMAFGPISDAMISLAEKLRPGGLNKFFCPMALGHGAYWLAKGDEVLNPYYGSQMLHCGAKQNF